MGFDPATFPVTFGSPGCIEITQGNKCDAMDFFIPLEDFLKDKFGMTVRIDGLLGAALINGNFFRHAISGTSGGENNFFTVGLDHGL